MNTANIEINPRVCGGKPIIRDTRIPVSVIIEQIANGDTWESILKGYPELTREDIQSALLYAKSAIDYTDIRLAAAG